MKIIPSILTNSPTEAIALLQQAEGGAKTVQVDIVDGVFVRNKTIDPSVFEGVETPLKLDFHLMVKEPLHWVEKCVRAGAERIIGQIEGMADQRAFVEKVQEANLQAGLALDIETPVSALDPSLLTDLDLVLIMNYPAGVGGQEFHSRSLTKYQKLDKIRRQEGAHFLLVSDGGITIQNIADVAKLGVDEVVVGKRIYEGNLAENIKLFLQKAESQD